MRKINKYYPEIIGGILCVMLGMFSGYTVKAADSIWYLGLSQPIFNPPRWLFAPVWTILYLMMGVALGKLWKKKHFNVGLIVIFILQFICNIMWYPLFFYFERIDLALVDLFAIWILLMFFIIAARKQYGVFLLFLPYMLWTTFALILNFSVYILN